jgi:uncharacterized protein (TIGR02611 family)
MVGAGAMRAMTDIKPVARWVGRSGRRAIVTVLGFTLVGVGLVLLVLPGPGLLVVIAGLAVLATEYMWARRALAEGKRRAAQARAKLRRRKPA